MSDGHRDRATTRTDLKRIWPVPRRSGSGREAVLEAVLTVIRDRGCEKARFQDVAELAGTSISALQYLFGSRDAMLIAGFQYGVERDLSYLDRIATGGGDPWTRLVAMVGSLVGDNGNLSGSRVEWLELWRASIRDPELFDACAAVYEAWRDRFMRTVEEGVNSGAFRIRNKPESIIAVLFALVDGMTVPILLELPLARDEVAEMITNWLADILGVSPASRTTDVQPGHAAI